MDRSHPSRGRLGASYCVEGSGECNNRQVVEAICTLIDQLRPQGAPHARLFTLVSDRPGTTAATESTPR